MKQLPLLMMCLLASGAFAQNQPADQQKCREIAALEAQLREMRRRYTEQHPHVLMTKQEIERLRNELAQNGVACPAAH